VDSFGNWSRIARATVNPPTPESNIPIGASLTGQDYRLTP
jgi:hypothetical protein